MVDIRIRLRKLQAIANKQEEVTAEDCMGLWMQYIHLMIINSDDGVPDITRYISPPFESVSAENYKNARKELEEFERQIN